MCNIARLALTESVAWVSGFLRFIDDYYEDLTQGKFGIKGNNFKNDPLLVSSELVKFLAVNTGFESIDKLQREVTELKKKVLASAKAVNLAEKSAFLAANKADDLKKFCDTL
eukprot:scaffold250596_cov26-Attheya_sp.AAC.1